MKGMIARMWHGRTPMAKADAYAAFLDARAMPDYRDIPGNLGAQVLRRDDGDVAHFVTLSYWESEDAIRAFAGDDLLKAKYYPEDEDFLLEFEAEVVHHMVISAG
ncbi:antibiotic biosynthesis monooxygenase family protein [Lysobacter fragariae]